MKKSIASPKTRVELNENLLADVTGGGKPIPLPTSPNVVRK